MRRTLLRVGLFMFLTAASFTSSSLLESRGALASPLPANPGLLNPNVSAACLTPTALLCVGFCCSGKIISYDSYEIIGIQVTAFDVLVTCSDGSSCIGSFQIYSDGSYGETTFGSNC